MKNSIGLYASYSKLSKELKNSIEILVSQTVFKLWIKTAKMLFGSITQEPLGLPLNFDAIFEFLGQLTKRWIIFQKGVDNFEIEHKTCSFLGVQYPPKKKKKKKQARKKTKQKKQRTKRFEQVELPNICS